jgi:SOS response regulatory protein OraA/RecX
VAEARDRLRDSGLAASAAEALLREWRRLGYLDDRRLAYTYFSARSERRLEGRRKLVEELRRRGVGDAVLAEVAREAVDEEAERRHLRLLIERKIAVDGPPDGPRAYARLVRFLSRRGFEAEAIREALDPRRSEGAWDEGD